MATWGGIRAWTNESYANVSDMERVFGNLEFLMERTKSVTVSAPDKARAVELKSVAINDIIYSVGELVPKRWAMKHKEKLADTACGIITVLTVILKPIIWFLSVSANAVLRLLGVNPKDDNETVSGENIVLMIDAGGDEGALDKEEKIYQNVITPRQTLNFAPLPEIPYGNCD